MNDLLRWHPSLVKKFSSSNHFKLLNQLRNEVKKYPLNNKKKTSSNLGNDNRNNQFRSSSHDDSPASLSSKEKKVFILEFFSL